MTPSILAPTITQKKWGSELLCHNADGYALKILRFNGGANLSLHYHINKTETWFVISGRFVFETRDRETGIRLDDILQPGDVLHLRRGQIHRLRCIKSGDIAEASTPDDPADSFRIEPSTSA